MNRRTLLAAAAMGSACLLVPRAFAQSAAPSEDEIANALRPRRKRGARTPEEIKAAQQIEDLRAIRRKRGLTSQESRILYQTAQGFPSLDLEIYFAFDSAEIGAEAVPVVENLGKAIKREDFNGSTIVVGGHTDGKGSEAYNQALSDKRADAVVKYLVAKFGLEQDRFLPTGYGFRFLKVAGQPLDPKNRRVQISAVPAEKRSDGGATPQGSL